MARIKLAAEPVERRLVFFVLGIFDSFQELVVAPDAATVFRRTGVLSIQASEGQAPPVPVGLHPPMEPRYACTAGDLIVSYGTKALAETNAAISYTSAAILDQAVRVFLNLLNEKEAKDNLRNIAGLVVVKQYQRRPDSYPSDNFWKNVTDTVLFIVIEEYKKHDELRQLP